MSSSGTTDEPGDRGRVTVAGHRHVGAVLLVAGTLAVLLIVGGVLALLGQGSTTNSGAPKNRLVGLRLPAASFPRLQLIGAPGRLVVPWVHHHGTVLLFFADWCTVCHGELHQLAPVLGNGRIGTVRVVGIEEDASNSTAARFVAANHVRFLVAHDPSTLLASALVPEGLPSTVFVSPTGKIVAVEYGVITPKQLSAGISRVGRAASLRSRGPSSAR